MLRRHFLATATIAAAIPAKSILTHDHALVDFIGADAIRPGRYDPDEVFRLALPTLKELRALGCRRLLECTPNFLGRDPRLLRRLAKAANLEIWTNTGLYGAAEFKFLPAYARTETASQLAQRWIAEARNGVDGERVRFIKTGVNRGPLHPLDRKLVHAAIETAKATGLTMAVHTGDGRAALDQLAILEQSGLPVGERPTRLNSGLFVARKDGRYRPSPPPSRRRQKTAILQPKARPRIQIQIGRSLKRAGGRRGFTVAHGCCRRVGA